MYARQSGLRFSCYLTLAALAAERGLKMASNDEKISKFNLAINHYAEEQRAKIQQEVDEFKQRETGRNRD